MNVFGQIDLVSLIKSSKFNLLECILWTETISSYETFMYQIEAHFKHFEVFKVFAYFYTSVRAVKFFFHLAINEFIRLRASHWKKLSPKRRF